jgi:Rubrerythrin
VAELHRNLAEPYHIPIHPLIAQKPQRRSRPRKVQRPLTAPNWLERPLGIEKVRDMAEMMERQARQFYLQAAARTTDADTRKLLGELATAEKGRESPARKLGSGPINFIEMVGVIFGEC